MPYHNSQRTVEYLGLLYTEQTLISSWTPETASNKCQGAVLAWISISFLLLRTQRTYYKVCQMLKCFAIYIWIFLRVNLNLIGNHSLAVFKWMRYGKVKFLSFSYFKGNSKERTQLDLIKCMQSEVRVVVNLSKFSVVLPRGWPEH